MPLQHMVIPCPCWKGQGGAGRECFITRWECLSSVFYACNVLSRSSHLVPITPGIQAAATLRIAVKHPNKHARKCHTIHHALPMESRALERRHNSSCFVFFLVFFSGTLDSSRLALGWCAVTAVLLVQLEDMIPMADDPVSSHSGLAGK